MKKLLQGVLGAVAPTLGTALGGPMGGMAAEMIAEKLGLSDTNPKTVQSALSKPLSKEDSLKLKEAELQFEKDMAEIAVKLNELLDSAIVYENYQQMPSLVNIFSRAMYMTFRNLMLFHIND